MAVVSNDGHHAVTDSHHPGAPHRHDRRDQLQQDVVGHVQEAEEMAPKHIPTSLNIFSCE